MTLVPPKDKSEHKEWLWKIGQRWHIYYMLFFLSCITIFSWHLFIPYNKRYSLFLVRYVKLIIFFTILFIARQLKYILSPAVNDIGSSMGFVGVVFSAIVFPIKVLFEQYPDLSAFLALVLIVFRY